MLRKARSVFWLAMFPVFLLLSGTVSPAWADEKADRRYQVNMEPGVTDVGADIFSLHMLIFWICVVIGIVVFGVMFYSIYAHRKSRGVTPATFHESTKVEIAWTVVPFLILLGMAVPATSTLIEVYDTEDAEIDILVTGYQWKWKYEYLADDGENVSFFSNLKTSQEEIYNEDDKGQFYLLDVDEPIVIPVDTKVRFLVTAYDVIHSMWVPELAVKKDAIPGFINETWTRATKTGIYRGQCAELCGKDHGFMPVVVNVVEREEYDQWLAEKQTQAAEIAALMEQTFTMDELVARGKSVYDRACLACHGANGEGGVGKAIAGSAIAMGPLGGHMDIVINGSRNNAAMQAFGGQLNDVDMAAVLTFQRNAFGNNMGDMIQPIDVYNYKQGQ
ncbi:MAG: cytochrome c oxidase subunit II [Halieaceae bacterium]|nr:cytochrome c oxidase subunit II [Halieaceae bacterium]